MFEAVEGALDVGFEDGEVERVAFGGVGRGGGGGGAFGGLFAAAAVAVAGFFGEGGGGCEGAAGVRGVGRAEDGEGLAF